MEKNFNEQIKKNGGDIIAAKRLLKENGEWKKYSDLAFPWREGDYLFNGMTLSINDLWGSNIRILNYKCDGQTYSGTVRVTLYDHFGLDEPDVQLDKPYVKVDGFRAWFVLQHYVQFNGKYIPFVNLYTYDIPISGEL